MPLVGEPASKVQSVHIGSARDEVLAAQGSPPTFVARKGLWWGSSKVTFRRMAGSIVAMGLLERRVASAAWEIESVKTRSSARFIHPRDGSVSRPTRSANW